jgi:hypothetical protein
VNESIHHTPKEQVYFKSYQNVLDEEALGYKQAIPDYRPEVPEYEPEVPENRQDPPPLYHKDPPEGGIFGWMAVAGV